MTIFYSPQTGGFYDTALEYPAGLPADCVEVPADRHAPLLAALNSGQRIEISRSGKLLVIAPAPARSDLIAAIRAEAARRIGAIAPLWRQLNDTRAPTPQSAARFAAIDAVRAASTLIEQDLADTADKGLRGFPVADHPAWPIPTESD